MKNSLARVRSALLIELSNQRGLVESLIQFKCTKYFRLHLTLVPEDMQCFNSIFYRTVLREKKNQFVTREIAVKIFRTLKLDKTRNQSPMTQ